MTHQADGWRSPSSCILSPQRFRQCLLERPLDGANQGLELVLAEVGGGEVLLVGRDDFAADHVVVDPFAGSGTTGIEAWRLGRP